jgi:hypothetical protein
MWVFSAVFVFISIVPAAAAVPAAEPDDVLEDFGDEVMAPRSVIKPLNLGPMKSV